MIKFQLIFHPDGPYDSLKPKNFLSFSEMTIANITSCSLIRSP